MKALKIVGSILLVLVLVAGTYVGVITKGFRKWKNLKTEKQNVTNFINYGKNGIPSEDYKALANENENLTKTVDDLTEDNSKLLSEKTTLTNQVGNLTDEKNMLSEKNSELQNKIKEYEEISKYLTTDYYIENVTDYITAMALEGPTTKSISNVDMYQSIKGDEFKELYDFFVDNTETRFMLTPEFHIKKIGASSGFVLRSNSGTMRMPSVIANKNYSIVYLDNITDENREKLLAGDSEFSCYYKVDISFKDSETETNKFDVNIVFNISNYPV